MVNTKVTLCGVKLDNPVIPASGTFGYGYEFARIYDINCLGTFSFKGTTRAPRFGNPTPRIAECGAGMINAVGLQNPGIDAVIREELPRLKTFFRKPVIANISGFSVEEYAYCCERIDREEQVGLIDRKDVDAQTHHGKQGKPAAQADHPGPEAGASGRRMTGNFHRDPPNSCPKRTTERRQL